MTISPLIFSVVMLAVLAVGGAAGFVIATYRTRNLREELAVAETRVQGLNDRLRDAHANTERRIELDREEQRVLQQLVPLRDSLGKLERTVVGIEQQRAVQHGELAEQLRQAARAEEKLRGTAEGLASALRSNNTRGLWGETQLRRIIEASGMLEHVDFEVQQHIKTERGALRPDMVVKLPGGKSIAIDAKVPFDAYLEAQHLGAESGGDPTERAARQQALLTRHARALRDHVIELSGRDYSSALGDSPEFVIAFVPSESLLSAALDTDPVLLEFAFERRVALASPVSLWAILKSVAFSWRQESLTSEARTLFELGRELHKRLGVSATHLDKLGRTLSRGVQGYNAYIGSLERQVLPTARKISALNGAAIDEPVQLEDAVRPLTAPELASTFDPVAEPKQEPAPELNPDPKAEPQPQPQAPGPNAPTRAPDPRPQPQPQPQPEAPDPADAEQPTLWGGGR
ncbi:DNA recombination protein RmuC [Leucobacter aridicollis]|uniref:DNA recombination protein RmuC n=1 Tax=Leucobacter aridicollis TaxID=283878 RepID=A0A852RCB4_9MICO|nr:DNA recombination protein RmuC [Leucobacter aridicollis]NYD25994.1 DNA recombination protein RmuC [Leucobacter aridicollis]